MLLPERFWKKVAYGPVPASRPDLGPCWLWVGAKNANGYGKWGNGKQTQYVHVAAYEAAIGPVPGGLELDHLCRVRHCCNPVHLEPVTHQENITRGDAGKYLSVRTHCPKGHEYTKENTELRVRNGSTHKRCRTCSRADALAYYYRQKDGTRILHETDAQTAPTHARSSLRGPHRGDV